MIENIIEELDIDAIFIKNKYNLRYVTGFSGTTGLALITKKNKYFFTDFRYTEQADIEVKPKGFSIIETERDALEKVNKKIEEEEVKKLGIENKEVTLEYYEKLKEKFSDIEFEYINDELLKIRRIKNESEIANIKEAIRITDESFNEITSQIKVGMTETEVAAKLEYLMRKRGATDKSFETIVASGHRSAMPHGVASDKRIGKNEFVKMDYGCYYNGYVSDMTRTVFIGEPTNKHKEIYNTVLEAQKLAISKVKAGMKAKDLDKIARDYITSKGYGDNFGHGLGHGIGLEIHESPGISQKGEIELKENMVITIEPGIYIEGFGGVRIEDDVVVKKDGCEVLNKSPKDELITIDVDQKDN